MDITKNSIITEVSVFERCTVEIKFTPQDEMRAGYSEQTFIPDSATVVFTRRSLDDDLQVNQVNVGGQRVLKGGKLGRERRDRRWWLDSKREEPPQWLQDVVEQVRP